MNFNCKECGESVSDYRQHFKDNHILDLPPPAWLPERETDMKQCHCYEFIGGCAMHRDDETVYEQFVDLMCDTFDADEMAYQHVIQQQAIEDEADGHA